ncbi:CoA transferase, partial [Clostridioides difficile]
CGNDKLFEKLCKKVLFREDLLIDERFKTNLNRCEHYKALKPEIEKWSVKHTIKEAVDLISEAGVPAAPIYNLDCVTTDEHIAKAREMIVDISHPIIGNMKVNGNP